MDQIATRPRGFGWRLVAAALAPFVAASGYLLLSRWPSYHFTTFSDYAGLGFSVLIGAAFIVTLPIRAHLRFLSVLIYLPVVAGLVFYFTFWFIAVVFHDGL
jgi:hypothetical protein